MTEYPVFSPSKPAATTRARRDQRESDITAATAPDGTDDTSTVGIEPDGSTTDATEPDAVSATDPAPTHTDEPASDVDVADGADNGTNDPAAITIGAILGAGLLLAVAGMWTVRMNRSGDDAVGIGETDDGSAPGDRR